MIIFRIKRQSYLNGDSSMSFEATTFCYTCHTAESFLDNMGQSKLFKSIICLSAYHLNRSVFIIFTVVNV